MNLKSINRFVGTLCGYFLFVIFILAMSTQVYTDEQISPKELSVKQPLMKSIHGYGKSNCGPKVLKEICRSFGIDATQEELIALTNTKMGNTSMLGLLEAARAKNIDAIGLKTDLRGLKRLIKNGYQVVSYFSKNYHYVIVRKITKDKVYIFDPAMYEQRWGMPLSIFKKDWSGEVLVFGKQSGNLSRYSSLTKERMQEIKGGNGCANTNGGSGNNGGNTSSDPVMLNNGNLITTTNDILIPGKLPLEITRTYNAQVVSDVEKWIPTSSWVIEDGEYRGQGDYSIFDGIYADLDLKLDMKTIEKGEKYSYEVCSVSFRYKDRNSRYYFTIHTTGKIELAKFQNGVQYNNLAYKDTTSYSPLNWNTVRITATNSTGGAQTGIKVYINGALELQYTDTNPIPAGQVMIESYFCYGTFDNISISDGSSVVYSNDFTNNANGWIEGAAGTWYVSNGEYCSDSLMDTYKTYSKDNYTNFTLKLDMKTSASYANPWEVAWVNIRRYDSNNLYYFNIQTNGKVELVKKKNGVSTILSELYNTGYNPLVWNTIKIIAMENRFQIYINNRKWIDVIDNDPIQSGLIVLEAFRANVRFDNITIRNGTESYKNDFNSADDSDGIFGRNITFNYGIKAVEHTNGDITIITGRGRKLVYQPDLNNLGSYIAPRDIYDTLTKNSTGYYLRSKYGTKYSFDINGKLVSITDPNNNQITISYDLGGKPETVTDSFGRQLQIFYNTDDKVSSITDSLGRKIDYGYDKNGCLTSVTDQIGNSCSYAYYPNYNMASYTDAEGYIYKYSYYYNDKIYQQTDPDGKITTFDYLWDKTVVTNNNKESFYYEFYKENDEIKAKTDFLGYTEGYKYDSHDNITSFTDKNGNTTTYAYDTMGNVTSVTNPIGEKSAYKYESTYNRITGFTDTKGNAYTFEYDSKANLTKVTAPAPLNYVISATYDSNGNILTIINALGNTTTYTYDSNGYLSSVTDPLNNITLYTHDACGRLTSKKDANGNVTTYKYDENNNLTKLKDALGNETDYTYDKNNLCINTTRYHNTQSLITSYDYNWAHKITRITDPGGRKTEYTYDLINYMHLTWALKTSAVPSNDGEGVYYKYDANARLKTLTDALTNETQYEYDNAGNLTKITDANGNVTNYTYDKLNRLLRTTYPDASNEIYSYDANSNLVSKIDRKAQKITYEYDKLNRKTKKTYPDSSKIDYICDSIGKLASVTYAKGTISYTYDKAGRLTQITYPGGEKVDYTHSAAGNLTKLTYPDGTTIDYVLDKLNRINQIKNATMGTIANYAYDSVYRKMTKSLNNNTYTTFSYDNSSNLLSLINQKNDSTIISSFAYTYDPVSYNRTSMTTLDGAHNYTYDVLYRLTGVTYPDSKTVSYTYDNLGNRLSKDDDSVVSENTYNKLNQLTQSLYNGGAGGNNIIVRGRVTDENISSVTVNGVIANISNNLFAAKNVPLVKGKNTITATATDLAKNTSQDIISVTLEPVGNITYKYDANGNITSNGIDGKTTAYAYDYDNRLIQVNKYGGTIIKYTYDPFGRRTEKDVNGVITKFIYSGNQIIQETDNSSVVKATHVYGLGIDEPLIMKRDGSTYYYYFDGLGSVSEITDNTGSVVEKYKYGPFGETTILDKNDKVITASPIGNPYTYTAREYDAETGLYYYRARYYDSSIGRFLSVDPVGYLLGPNLYTYVRNNPVNWRDPWGLWIDYGSISGGSIIDPIPEGPDIGPIGDPIPPDDDYGPPPDISPPEPEGPTGDPIPPDEGIHTWDEGGDTPGNPPPVPQDPTQSPGDGWVWEGKGPPGSNQGNWHNPQTNESLHPDLGHEYPPGPHWDWHKPDGTKQQLDPDGNLIK